MEKQFEIFKNTVPKFKEIKSLNPEGEFKGIKAITYDGANVGDKKTKAFAYIGFPEKICGKVPAIVLVHGGGGVSYLPWVKMWNTKGYAAIAMCNTGYFPKKINAGLMEHGQHLKEYWEYGLFGEFEEDGYVSSPKCDDVTKTESPYEEQFLYHAVSQTILASNILRDDSRVDENKIGITGISWGGIITSLTLRYDKRYAFAIPIYGSGYLPNADGGFCNVFFENAKNIDDFLAEKGFDDITFPVLWLCWDKDGAFHLDGNCRSYMQTVKNNSDTRISIVYEMNHSHVCGWVREESFVFADSVTGGGPKLPTFKMDGGKLFVDNPDNVHISYIRCFYLKEQMSYIDDEIFQRKMVQDWYIDTLKCGDYVIKDTVPEDAACYYYQITFLIDGREYITTSVCNFDSKKENLKIVF